jgi:hypothetical protein
VKKFVGRNNVESRYFCHAVRVIESHAVRNSSAAIVTHDREFLQAKAGHYFHLILRGRSF